MKNKPLLTRITISLIALFLSHHSNAQPVPLGQDKLVQQLNQELSGESAKRNVEFISRLHRMRGSKDYNQAIAFIMSELQEYKMASIEVIKIPADGKIMYGTQKSRPAWNADFGELWEMEQKNGDWKQAVKIADYQSIPLVIAQDSRSGEATADLVDIGKGTSETDYINKNVKGKLVLTSSQPEAVVSFAIEKYGALGIISYAQNQETAWSKENENLIRWGHLSTFTNTKTFAFMVSLKQARGFQDRFAKGENIRLQAKVIAEQTPGSYDILTAAIEGADPVLKNEEIAFTCHLDHPRPGANDNASGCMSILEVARTLNKLIAEGKIERPKRTIRFIWSPEIEGTIALLNFKPAMADKIKFNIHMDMVGGGPETKAIFHVSGSPQSLPGFINDVGEAFGDFVNQASDAYAAGEKVLFPIVAQEGGKEALSAVLGEFHMGSDFEVYNEGSFRIPSIYLHDWPDRYIHTNYDVAANIDATKMKRSAFIGAGSGYYLANVDNSQLPLLIRLMKRRALNRASGMLNYCQPFSPDEQENTKYYFWLHETEVFNSLKKYTTISPAVETDYEKYLSNLKLSIGKGKQMMSSDKSAPVIYTRNNQPKGPMTVFGYDYFTDHYKIGKEQPALLNFSSANRSGSEYAYEALNLVNGKNNISDIRNSLSAEFGPVPLELVMEYLQALESIGVIKREK
jgi:aminopeptidase YwaD